MEFTAITASTLSSQLFPLIRGLSKIFQDHYSYTILVSTGEITLSLPRSADSNTSSYLTAGSQIRNAWELLTLLNGVEKLHASLRPGHPAVSCGDCWI